VIGEVRGREQGAGKEKTNTPVLLELGVIVQHVGYVVRVRERSVLERG